MSSKIHEALNSTPLADYPRESRVHKLLNFDTEKARCFVKREDELGGMTGGSKMRKYLSLVPSLNLEKIEEAILIGSPFSNHILSLSQLLIQNQIQPTLFLRETFIKKQGNFLWTSLLVPPEKMHFISKENWPDLDSIIKRYAETSRKKSSIITEGGSVKAALPGTLTLALDILRNEEDLKLAFDHIIIDSGTGFTAINLLLAFCLLEKPTQIHIIQMFGNLQDFQKSLDEYKKDFEDFLEIPPLTPSYHLYFPKASPAFGSSNAKNWKNIVQVAQEEGFFTDPVFSNKLFIESKEIISSLKGNILIIHSGGYSALTGYQDQLSALPQAQFQI